MNKVAAVASKAEMPIMQGIARDFLKEIDAQGKPFVRQMVIEGQKAGLARESLQYLFFTVVERDKDWPTMPTSQKRALAIGRTIMTHSGDVPDYRDGLAIPDEAEEARIDKAIERVAFWCMTGMVVDLYQGYMRAIKAGSAKIQQATPTVPDRFKETYTKAVFENTLEAAPHEFSAADLMRRIVFILF